MLEKYYISKKDNTDLNVYRCGFEKCSPGYFWGPGVRDHYIIHIVSSGKGIYTVNGKTYGLEAGHGFLICPGQIVYYKADDNNPWTYYWVGFHGLKAEQVLKKAGLSKDKLIFSMTESDNLIPSLSDLINEARHNVSDLMLTGLLYRFLAYLVNRSENKTQAGDRVIDTTRYVSKAVEYIEKNFSGELTVQSVADYLKIDRSYLSTLFSKHLGTTPRDFIIKYRMDKACELLKNPQLSVSDVARSVGYEDPFQFSKTFKSRTGQSPLYFRKKL
ncbi:MAG TPA: AraC family transcriptional regulator [Clostridiaceae bacterium]|mgnify:FL=1|nr:AraC family transcriptional regulator [Clostridiaceae bacterium]